MINHNSMLLMNKFEREGKFSDALTKMVMEKYADGSFPKGKFDKIEFVVFTDNDGKITHVEAKFLE